jgi:chemotaxis signal transduction protein
MEFRFLVRVLHWLSLNASEGGPRTLSILCRNIEFLRFEVASRSFCVDVDQVLGVITLPANLNEAPSVVPFHNEDILVYSLERLLDLEENRASCPQEIIVLAGATENYGISVDLIGQIYKVPIHRSIFRFPASSRSGIRMFGVWGMAVLANELALILEPRQLLKEQTCAEIRAERLFGSEATIPGEARNRPHRSC